MSFYYYYFFIVAAQVRKFPLFTKWKSENTVVYIHTNVLAIPLLPYMNTTELHLLYGDAVAGTPAYWPYVCFPIDADLINCVDLQSQHRPYWVLGNILKSKNGHITYRVLVGTNMGLAQHCYILHISRCGCEPYLITFMTLRPCLFTDILAVHDSCSSSISPLIHLSKLPTCLNSASLGSMTCNQKLRSSWYIWMIEQLLLFILNLVHQNHISLPGMGLEMLNKQHIPLQYLTSCLVVAIIPANCCAN